MRPLRSLPRALRTRCNHCPSAPDSRFVPCTNRPCHESEVAEHLHDCQAAQLQSHSQYISFLWTSATIPRRSQYPFRILL